eukprot:TRINITY_DN28541_c0_g1_i1.p1 TRINITY_DN28541_c0_g1~~TRINITY_DN28541_c0_g1_i1.p1  ORF type:complete len:320 (-),score=32.36 TRINITY_DN28541_c0_g1_i1:242-1201(-)
MAAPSWGRTQPARIMEADVQRTGAIGVAPTTVLSLWQPLASFLAHGLQRIEGRGWSTKFRGPLWIHAGSKQVSPEDIAKWESLYREVHATDGNNVKLPEAYPTSALVGLVEVVDVIAADEFRTWKTLSRGVRQEGQSHGSGSLFLVQKHRKLLLPLKMSGQHKLWRLDLKIAERIYPHLVSSEQSAPIDFAHHRELAAHATATEGCENNSDDGDSDGDGDEDLDVYMLELAMQRSLADSDARISDVQQVARGTSEDNLLLKEATSTSNMEGYRCPNASLQHVGTAQSAENAPSEHTEGAKRRGRWGRGRAAQSGRGNTS